MAGLSRGPDTCTKQELPSRPWRVDWLSNGGTHSLGHRIQHPLKQKWSPGEGQYLTKELTQGPEGSSGEGANG